MVRSLAVALPYYFGGLHNLQSMLLPKKLVGFTPPPLKIADRYFNDVKNVPYIIFVFWSVFILRKVEYKVSN